MKYSSQEIECLINLFIQRSVSINDNKYTFLYKMHTLVIIFIFQVKQTQVMVSNTEIDIR